MNTFLTLVGAFVAALAVLMVALLLWLRWKWRSFVRQVGDSVGESLLLQGAFPCEPLELEPTQDPDWTHGDWIERETAALEGIGFVPAGEFVATGPVEVTLRGFAHTGARVWAALYDSPALSPWADVVVEEQDGTIVTYASTRGTGLRRPPEKPAVWMPEATTRELFERLQAERRAPRRPVAPERFAETVRRLSEEETAWQIARGGPDEAEIRAVAERSGTEATPEAVAQVRQAYRLAANDRLDKRLRQEYLAGSRVSAAAWEDLRDRVLFIHDGLDEETLLSHWEMARSWQETESEDGAEDEARALLAGVGAREGFRRLNECLPADRCYRKLDELDRPVAADVYEMPRSVYEGA